jgi:hypothetical protein
MQMQRVSAATAIPLILVIAASLACWAGLAAVASGLIDSWNMSGF